MRSPGTNRYPAGMICWLDIRHVDVRCPTTIRPAVGGRNQRFHRGGWVTVAHEEAPEPAADAMPARPNGSARWAGPAGQPAAAMATRFGVVAATA